MASVLEDELGVCSTLVRGGRGIFEVRLKGNVVARKTLDGFPSERQVLDAVREAMG